MPAAERKRRQIAIQVLAGGVPLYIGGVGLFIFLFYPSCFFLVRQIFYYALGKI